MTTTLRVLINDVDAALYTDAKLQNLLSVAAFQVVQEVMFEQFYTIRPDPTTPSISPDPTESATRDDSFINLVILKAAAITDRGAATLAVRRAVSFREGASAVDLEASMRGWLDLLKKGWDAVYKEAKLQYQCGLTPVAGVAVMTPFRDH